MGSFISAKEQNGKRKCLICEEDKNKGIHLLNYFICDECEHDIVCTETNERGYTYYLSRLKKVRNSLIEIKKDKVQ